MESLQVEGVISSWSTAEAGSERRESGGGVNGDDMIIDKDKVERVGDDERGQDVNGAEDKINENGEVGTRTTGEDSNGLLTGETPVAAPPPHLGGGDALKDTGGSDEIPALPSDAMDEDKVDGSDKKDTLAGSLDDLAPLPTEFDPDAPLSPIENADPADEEDELAIVPREEEKQEVAAEEAMDVDEEAAAEGDEGDLSARQDGTPADEEDAPEAEAEDGHEPSDQPDSNLLDILRGLQNKEEEEEEGAGEDNEAEPQRPASPSPFNSPLTPLPELPDELPPDSELPPPAAAPPAEQWAESSAQAAARSSAGILGLSISREDRKRRGEAPVRYGTFTEEDELASSSDADDKRQKYKRKRGLDGKPIRSSKQPRKRLDAQLGITRHGDKPPDKVAPRAKTLSDAKLKELVRGKTREVQLAPCIRPRYGCWGKCTQCVSKIGGDQCRFRNYRVFPLDPATADIIGPGKFESTTLDEAMTALPREFNTALTEAHIVRTEQTVAPLLLSYITQELRHVVKNDAIYRPVDTAKHRSVCDFCASTVFGGFWFCRKCGRDFCLQCERYFSDSVETMRQSPWPLPDAARPRLHHCTRGPDSDLPLTGQRERARKFFHHRGDLQPTSRFTRAELEANWLALVEYVLEPGQAYDLEERINSLGVDSEELLSAVREWYATHPAKPASGQPSISDEDIAALYDASKSLPWVVDPAGVPPLRFMFVEVEKLTNEDFDVLWARGEPMVVGGVGSRFKLDWSPDAFIGRFGDEQCYVVDCVTESSQVMSIGKFFTMFKEAEERGKMVEAPKVAEEKSGGSGAPAEEVREKEAVADDSAQNGRVEEPLDKQAASEAPRDGPPQLTNGQHNPDANGTSTVSTADASRSEEEKATPAPSGAAPDEKPQPSPYASPSPLREVTSSPKKTGSARSQPQKILKLKDWPMTDDFESAYPALYHDFSDALPVPDYTRRNGVLNLYSHFPPGPTRPDIGPKMYNAFASDETTGGQGSTRLHMDVADAINIMLHASPREDGTPGCAVWDLYRAEDADKLRAFLKAKFPQEVYTDPIHSQKFYLDAELRAELYAKHGVASFRVYQYPGQAVFIPAGCAHQVCNLANCIKIALDFVSPHNVRRCQQLSQDFRKENFVRAWKDDVLQLYNVMWYAWTNVRELREEHKRQAAEEEAKHAARNARLAELANGQTQTLAQLHPAPHGFLSPATSSVRDDPGRPASTPPTGSPAPGGGVTAGSISQAGAATTSTASATQDSATATGPPQPTTGSQSAPSATISAAATPTAPTTDNVPAIAAAPAATGPASATAATSMDIDADNADKGTAPPPAQEPTPHPKDKHSESGPESALLEATAAPAHAHASPPADAERKRQLAQRLMDAALAREPQPIVLEPSTVTGMHAQQQAQRRNLPKREASTATPEPTTRLSDSIRNGHISADLALHVVLGEMGGMGARGHDAI